jgi:hypothetical protein
MAAFSHLGAALSIARVVQRLTGFKADITTVDLLGHTFDVSRIGVC